MARRNNGLLLIGIIGIGAYFYLTRNKAEGATGQGEGLLGGISNIFSPAEDNNQELDPLGPRGTPLTEQEKALKPNLALPGPAGPQPTPSPKPQASQPQQQPLSPFQTPPVIPSITFNQPVLAPYSPYIQGAPIPSVNYIPSPQYQSYANQVNSDRGRSYEPSNPFTSIFAQSANQRTITQHGKTRQQINAGRSGTAVSRTSSQNYKGAGISNAQQRQIANTVTAARATGRVTSRTTNAFQRPASTQNTGSIPARSSNRITSTKGGVSKKQQISVLNKVRNLRAGG